jgi:antitoxin PrlF
MPTATITSKGQITLPKEIRRHLKIDKGDRVEFFIDVEGRVTVVPATSDIRELKSMLPKPPKPVSAKEMRKAIREEGGRL